jgi:hypothetical protein
MLILKRLGGRGLDACSPGYVPVVSIYEHANEASGSSRCRQFLDYLSLYLFLKQDFTPWS